MNALRLFIVLLYTGTVLSLCAVIFQQGTDLWDNWLHTSHEYEQAERNHMRSCLGQQHTDPVISAQCDKLSLLLLTHPFVRALNRLTASWHSCLYVPCERVMMETPLKLLGVLLALTIGHFLFSSTVKLTQLASRVQDRYRNEYTYRYIERRRVEVSEGVIEEDNPLAKIYRSGNWYYNPLWTPAYTPHTTTASEEDTTPPPTWDPSLL